MITNLLELFNYILKGARAILVSALMQLIFYNLNSYWVKWRHETNDFIQ
jgi:hypothetical protein